ncbi:MAG TPA: hypothetical protein VGE52_02455, partial [Pirellulales bacterium]
CSECQTLLSVGRRKIGEAIDCPKCGSKQTVPETDALSGAKVEKRIPRSERAAGQAESDGPSDASSARTTVAPGPAPADDDYYRDVEFIIYEDDDDPPGATVPAGAPLVRATEGPAADHIVLPRSLWNMTLLAFVVIAAGAFGLGFWLGGRHATPPKSAAASTSESAVSGAATTAQTIVQGQVHYRSGPGVMAGDGGAVVLAVPRNQLPETKLSHAGLRPDDAAGDARTAAQQALAAAGGGFQQVVADGEYFLTLPAPGNYWLLVVSKHVPRTVALRGDATPLSRYFDSPDELLKGKEYRVQPLDAPTALVRAPAIEFGT